MGAVRHFTGELFFFIFNAFIIMQGKPYNFDPITFLLLEVSFFICCTRISRLVTSPVISISRIMFWLYSGFLLCLPAIAQTYDGNFYWGVPPPNYILAKAAFILLLGIGSFCFGEWIGGTTVGDTPFGAILAEKDAPVATRRVFYAMIFFCVVALILLGPSHFLKSRGDYERTLENVQQSDIGLMSMLPRGFTLCGEMLLLHRILNFRNPWRLQPNTSYDRALFFFGLPMFVIFNWPPAVPRFIAFGTFLTVYFAFFMKGSARERFRFVMIFMVGLFIAMPFYNSFTRGANTGVNWDVQIPDVFEYLHHGDLDGFQSISNGVYLVEDQGLGFGHQIISTILFFVPRSFWSWKAEPTGALIAEWSGYTFTNLSAPLYIEAYIDFGYAGILAFFIFLGAFLSHMDGYYTKFIHGGTRNFGKIMVSIFTGFSIIIYRGPLLGIIGPIASTLGPALLVGFSIRRRRASSLRKRFASNPQ